MSHSLLDSKLIEQAPPTFLPEIGQLFSGFDERSLDCG